jgi:hypothetical protein
MLQTTHISYYSFYNCSYRQPKCLVLERPTLPEMFPTKMTTENISPGQTPLEIGNSVIKFGDYFEIQRSTLVEHKKSVGPYAI